MKKIVLSLAIVAGMLGATNAMAESTKDFYTMNDMHELVRPTNYRSWIYVGTPVTPNELNNGHAPFPEMHNVYIDPMSYKEYKATGKFREGTVIVKELVSVGSTSAVSGKGYFAGEFLGLEASIKSKKDFPDEPGNWAIFSFSDMKTGMLKETSPVFPASSCVTCHQVNAADDFVFTQYYPILSAAKGVGANVNPEDSAKRSIQMMKKMSGKKQAAASSDGAELKPNSELGATWVGAVATPQNSTLDIPLEERALFSYLQSGKYKSWKYQEKAVHSSTGPHENVRAFMNDTIGDSLKMGKKEHPKGSMIVKEQYDANGNSLGWAVMVKTGDKTDKGNGWFWYEALSDKDITKKAAIGNGVPGCVGCHTSSRRDMVLIPFPFK